MFFIAAKQTEGSRHRDRKLFIDFAEGCVNPVNI